MGHVVAAQYIEVVVTAVKEEEEGKVEGKGEGDRKEKRRMVMAVVITLSRSLKTELSAPTLCHSKCGPCTSRVSIAGKLVRNQDSQALPPTY